MKLSFEKNVSSKCLLTIGRLTGGTNQVIGAVSYGLSGLLPSNYAAYKAVVDARIKDPLAVLSLSFFDQTANKIVGYTYQLGELFEHSVTGTKKLGPANISLLPCVEEYAVTWRLVVELFQKEREYA